MERTYAEPEEADNSDELGERLQLFCHQGRARFVLDTRRGSEERNVHLTRLPYTCFIHVVMLIEKVVRWPFLIV